MWTFLLSWVGALRFRLTPSSSSSLCSLSSSYTSIRRSVPRISELSWFAGSELPGVGLPADLPPVVGVGRGGGEVTPGWSRQEEEKGLKWESAIDGSSPSPEEAPPLITSMLLSAVRNPESLRLSKAAVSLGHSIKSCKVCCGFQL